MKSIKAAVNAQCPRQCPGFEAEVWSFICGGADEDLKTAIMGGELNLLVCPSCGTLFHYQMPLVYFDPGMEILAFVFPDDCQAERGKWLAKMQEDFNVMRSGLLREMNIDFEPRIFFGMSDLRKFLGEDEDLKEESEVICALASETGFSLKKMKPSVSRSRGVPLVVPYAGKTCTESSVLEASAQLLGASGELARLKTFFNLLASGGDEASGLL